MKDNEFKELNIFGEKIERKNENKNCSKNKELKTNKKDIKKKLIRSIERHSKNFLIFLKSLYKKIIITILKDTQKKIQNKINSFRLENKKNIGYKIIETKKERRNKVIIIRKRVPIKLNININTRNEKPSLYYYNLKTEKDKNCKSNISEYIKIKRSVWDFPLEKKLDIEKLR